MYDFPEVREATTAFWRAVASRIESDVPLSHPADWTAAWRQRDLLFSQTCGYPFTHEFREKLALVATPHYQADGCEGPRYRSIVFAREDRSLRSFKGKVAAFNNRDSMSGMLALQLVFAPLAEGARFFSRAIESGGHLASLAAVQAVEADICAIDCVTVAYARRYRPSALEGLVEVARSPDVPALPFVTVAGNVPRLQQALRDVFADASQAETLATLMLKDVSFLSSEDYDEIVALEAVMERRGGLVLW
jgi:ABC-type phosphate/phosphonate transport system substrate-binding protein